MIHNFKTGKLGLSDPEIETDKIWEAQKERISKATIVPYVVNDEEETLNGIRW